MGIGIFLIVVRSIETEATQAPRIRAPIVNYIQTKKFVFSVQINRIGFGMTILNAVQTKQANNKHALTKQQNPKYLKATSTATPLICNMCSVVACEHYNRSEQQKARPVQEKGRQKQR